MRTFSLYLGVLIMGWGCSNPSPNKPNTSVPAPKVQLSAENDSLYKLVVAVHDSVMPKMSDISVYQSKISKQIGSSTPKDKEALLNKSSELKKAENAMMLWMNEFKNTEVDEAFYQKMSAAEIRNYLLSEEKKIREVSFLMLNSLKPIE